MSNARPRPRLFAFDFELTITSSHVDKSNTTNEKQYEQALKDIAPRDSARRWKDLFEKLIAEGYPVAIFSEFPFPGAVQSYLRDNIGLSAEDCKKIFLCCEAGKGLAGKNGHILKA